MTVLAGWLMTAASPLLLIGTRKILIAWTLLMAIPILLTAWLRFEGRSNRLFDFWAVLVSILMAQNWLAPSGYRVLSFFALWFAAVALGFYYTSSKVPGKPGETYRYAAYASAAALPVVLWNWRLGIPIAVLIQGTPMIYNYLKFHR
ncbi:MAG: hypothetical protein ABEJ36_06585 [Candidatus Nanosalina sp.]